MQFLQIILEKSVIFIFESFNGQRYVGARFYILAIRMNLSFDEFENRFNKGGYYNKELNEWFYKNYKKFPDEFADWEKEIEDFI